MAERVTLYDTTLRDGAQTQGVDFTAADKFAIARALDSLGIDYIEGGWPGANPTDDAFFAAPPPLGQATLTAFGMTRRPGRSAANDPSLAAVLSAAPACCLVGKSWTFQVEVALGIGRDENLALIRDSVAAGVAAGREMLFDAEHFFDGYAADPGYALACLSAALEGGAAWLVLCDTNGGTLPGRVARVTDAVAAALPGARLGIHPHNDCETAVANALAAVEAGARMVQGTLNGLGERCGNASLISLIPNLTLKLGYETCVSAEGLTRLTEVSRLLDQRLGRPPDPRLPYVGRSAFAHKGGLHASAVARDPRTYEHIDPALVGNRRHVVISDQAGRASLAARLAALGLQVAGDDPRLAALLDLIKRREAEGWSYDGADASFALLARAAFGGLPDYYRLEGFRVLDERRWSEAGPVSLSEATVKLSVGGRRMMTVAEGNGPVNALDGALRRALVPLYPGLGRVELIDYKVRILDGGDGTGAVTRVTIETEDGGRRRMTIGVSANIIDASFAALHDALVAHLVEAGTPPATVAPPAASERLGLDAV